MSRTHQIPNDIKRQIVEPMQTVHVRPRLTCTRGRIRYPIPLLDQLLQIVRHVLLELADALYAKGMRDGLSLASVFGTITGIEEAALDGDEGIVVIAKKPELWSACGDQIRRLGTEDLVWARLTSSAILLCGCR